jgi:hypothetical protein
MRTRICLYILLLVPLAVYWQTIFHDYGLREDYAYLRESREEPGQMVKLSASLGRPLYGALVETTYSATEHVDQLVWMRLATVLLLTVLGLAVWRQLYQSGWNEVESAVIGLGIVLLPSSQFVAGAASSWPQVLTLVLAMAGFSAIETEIERGGLKRVVALLGGCMIYAAAALIYQSNVLFALVPVTAIFLVRSGREPMTDLKWAAYHIVTLLAGLLFAYLVVQALFSNGVFEESVRMRLETNPFTKILWFFIQPLPNSLALFALADDHYHGVIFYALSLLLVLTLLVLGYRRSKAAGNAVLLRKWKICLFGLPFLAQVVSLVAAERAGGYRLIFALAALVFVLVMFAIRVLLEGRKIKPRRIYAGYGVVLLAVAFVAHRQSYLLVAEPQGHEWSLMKGAVLRAGFNKPVNAYIITPTPEHRTTDRLYRDEFGHLSSSSERVAQEMFKAAVRDRYQDKLPKGGSYTVTAGAAEPAADAHDLVIDMRRLQELREN